MNFSQIITDIGAAIAAVSAIATVLAHLPFIPAKYAEFLARIALYASNAKFSVNQRDTMPPQPKVPFFPMGGVLILTLALSAFSVGCSTTKPPCDQAKLAAVVLICTAQSQECKSAGKSKAECSSLAECDAEISAACGAGK